MSKKSATGMFSMFSTCGLILVVVSLLLLVVVGFNYLTKNIQIHEGFEQKTQLIVKEGPEVYDDFYVNIYDSLVFNKLKNDYEVGEIINSTKPTSESKILDIGSGTGHHVKLLTDKGVDAMGVDISQYMINKAKETHPDQKFVQGDALNPSLFSPDSFTHITCLYFGIYYFPDKRMFFKNCMKWLMSGGYLVVHLVDRDKFDPILPPANPVAMVSPQKYAKERITSSRIVFNNMNYSANFDITPSSSKATFNEKFKDKQTGKVRKNVHSFVMEPEKDIIVMAQDAGFILQGKIDLLNVGYEHQFLYIFVKPN